MTLHHGDFHIEVKGNIIILEMVGSFNEYSIKEYSEKIKEIVCTFEGSDFLYLINALKFVGATPEAFEEDNKFNKWLSENNLIGKAIVHTFPAQVAIAYSRESELTKQYIKEFNNESDAFKWLSSLS